MGHLEIVDAVQFIELLVEFSELVFEEGDVEGFELLEDLVGEDEVEAIDFTSAAGNVNRNEGLKLLHDTVSECKAEFLDDEVIKIFELILHVVIDWILT